MNNFYQRDNDTKVAIEQEMFNKIFTKYQFEIYERWKSGEHNLKISGLWKECTEANLYTYTEDIKGKIIETDLFILEIGEGMMISHHNQYLGKYSSIKSLTLKV
jgi:hypothetical protein